MTYPQMTRPPRRLALLSTLLIVVLAGCATAPRSVTPDVQREVKSRIGAEPAAPRSPDEQSTVDAAVTKLLQADLTPESAATIALLNNRHLRATFDELGVSEAEVFAAGRLPNPTFSASVRWPNRAPRSPNVELNAGIDVLNALLIPIRKHLAGEQLVAAERRVGDEALKLDSETKSAAYALQARQELRARLAAILETNQAAADFAQRQYDAGNINRLQLLTQQASMQDVRLELTRTDAEIRHDREKLNRLLGLVPAQTNWRMTAPLEQAPASDPNLDDLESLAVSQRLDISAAQSDLTIAHAAWDLKRKTRLLPAGVNVGIDTEREPGGTGGHSHVTGPNIELTLPLFDQGQADLARLSAEVRSAEARLEALKIDVQSEVREARDALLVARESAQYFHQTVLPQRRAILRETLLQYNAMQKSNYELLLAKQQELEAERSQIDALRDYWIARAELERAIGGRLTVNQP